MPLPDITIQRDYERLLSDGKESGGVAAKVVLFV